MRTSQKIYLPFKRLIGIFGSIIGIIFCLALFWWWILPINLIVTKGHPIFVQERYGKNEKVFKLLKFRSMRADVNPNLAPSEMTEEDHKKMETKFGTFLRKTSLDETLQLINIFLGQMAFIGPRPGAAHNEEHLKEVRKSYTPNAFSVKPGISGYAQVMMKRSHNPELKAEWDYKYVCGLNLWLDIKIFIFTILKLFGVLKGK